MTDQSPTFGQGEALSRRELFAALPVAGLAVALPLSSEANVPDPMLAIYHEWLEARQTWKELAAVPGNEKWDSPAILAAEAREVIAEKLMLETAPTSLEGIGALAALAWEYANPGLTDPQLLAEEVAQSLDCLAVIAIWRACTGLEGYPTT